MDFRVMVADMVAVAAVLMPMELLVLVQGVLLE